MKGKALQKQASPCAEVFSRRTCLPLASLVILPTATIPFFSLSAEALGLLSFLL